MKKLNKSQRKFLDGIKEQENNQHINASDAELEAMYGAPKHKKKPIVPECYVYVFEQSRTSDPDYV